MRFVDVKIGQRIVQMVPFFHRTSDTKKYLDWKEMMNFVLESLDYLEAKKVRQACSDFIDYAIVWQDKVLFGRKRCEENPIVTWEDMKRVMRKNFFFPNHYDDRSGGRDLHEMSFASTCCSSMEEKRVAKPMMDSTHELPKHEYQCTSKILNSCTCDINLSWCQENGPDIIQCLSELTIVADSKQRFNPNLKLRKLRILKFHILLM